MDGSSLYGSPRETTRWSRATSIRADTWASRPSCSTCWAKRTTEERSQRAQGRAGEKDAPMLLPAPLGLRVEEGRSPCVAPRPEALQQDVRAASGRSSASLGCSMRHSLLLGLIGLGLLLAPSRAEAQWSLRLALEAPLYVHTSSNGQSTSFGINDSFQPTLDLI